LIQILEDIRDRKTDQLNFPKAFLTMCVELQNIYKKTGEEIYWLQRKIERNNSKDLEN